MPGTDVESAGDKPGSQVVSTVAASIRDLAFAGAIFAYFGGFIYLYQYRQHVGIPTDAITDVPLYQLYVYAAPLVTYGRTPIAVWLSSVLCVLCVAIVLLMVRGRLPPTIMKLLTPTVMKLLTYVIVVVFGAIAFNGVFSLANYAAEKEARIVTRCDQILRARLVLTHAAKRKYDKRFRKENDALSLRYISQNDKYIYVMYHDFVIWHDVKHKPPVLREYYGFTYAVPRTDVDLLIIRDPPKNPNGKC